MKQYMNCSMHGNTEIHVFQKHHFFIDISLENCREVKNLEFITSNKFHKESWDCLIILFLAFYVLVLGTCKAHGLFKEQSL